MDQRLEIIMFFEPAPGALVLYDAVERAIREITGEVEVRVQKTQITFKRRYGFAVVSLPRRARDRAAGCILLSILLDHPLEDARVEYRAETYPGRWINHMTLSDPAQLDDCVRGWLEEAVRFTARGR